MNTFSAGSAIRFGWGTFKKRPMVFVGAAVAIAVASWVAGAAAGAFGQQFPGAIIGGLINAIAGMLIGMGEAAFFLKAERDATTVELHDLWHPRPFWKYVGATILATVIILIGFVLLIVPGVIASLMLMFASYIVIDRGLSPVDALKESRRITRGHLGQLFLLVLAFILLNIVGAICLLIGLLVTIPVTMLALVHAYRSLSTATM